ncbi:helicase domino-like [Culex pipiens pallens]|uniref:helicase domino-like n=1 Tax=Culex pipiens pallens TaxID=42434 RepID=UPI0019531793|nr:helicase domino-like [Culex pipiens pallens]
MCNSDSQCVTPFLTPTVIKPVYQTYLVIEIELNCQNVQKNERTKTKEQSGVQHGHSGFRIQPRRVKTSNRTRLRKSRMAPVLHLIILATQFLDPDCGKRQTFKFLLECIKSSWHRVLRCLFTCWTFWRRLQLPRPCNPAARRNNQGRADSTVDKSLQLDKRMFVLNRSTRSGGISTESVVFYDSESNPTRDAQAQVRCYKLGL